MNTLFMLGMIVFALVGCTGVLIMGICFAKLYFARKKLMISKQVSDWFLIGWISFIVGFALSCAFGIFGMLM